jgi:hypothetical protein
MRRSTAVGAAPRPPLELLEAILEFKELALQIRNPPALLLDQPSLPLSQRDQLVLPQLSTIAAIPPKRESRQPRRRNPRMHNMR